MKQKLSAVGLPLLTLLVTAALGVVWAIAHKTRLESYYTDLAYRTLADIGDVVRDKVFEYDVALSNACKEESKEGKTCTKWAGVVLLRPSLLSGVRDKEVVPRSRLVYYTTGASVVPEVKLDLQVVASQITTDFFDDLILCDDESNVLYQKSQYGRRVVKCSSIFAGAGGGEKKEKETASQWVLAAEGLPFRVFEHRIELENPNTKIALGGSGKHDKPVHLTVLGLIRQQRLDSEVLAFPFTLSFAFIFIVFVAFFSIPMVRVSMLRPNQRLRRWDGAWLTASTYFTASLVTFGLLTLVYYRFEAGQGIDRRLAEIAKEVEDNAGAEFLYQRNVLKRVMDAAKSCRQDGKSWKESECPVHPGDGKLAEFIVPENDDRDKAGAHLSYFDPTLDLVSFTRPDGQQVAKWTMKPGTPANLITVKDRGFFRAVVERRMWTYSPKNEETPGKIHEKVDPVAEFFLEPLVSRTTAENVVVQSILPAPDPGIVFNITSRPTSLFGVFMQPGFGFAIIDRNGDILFHSQQARNLHENLFDDCMDPSEIRSAANGRSMRTVDVNYLGRDHRFLMRPLVSFAGSPWTLVTFYDREHLRSIMAGMITVTLALFLGYTLLAVLGLVILVTLGVVRNVSVSGFANPIVLLWPDEETHGNYRGLIAWFATLLIVEAIALASLPPLALTFLVAVMPLIAVALAPAWLRFFNWQSTPWVRHLPLRRRYTLAAALLLIMTTVVPCTAFFRTAFDYEMGLAARHEMAALMRHLRAIKSNAEVERRSDAYLKSLELHERDTDRRAGLSGEYLRSRIESSIRLGVYSCAAFVPKKGMVLAHQAERFAECPFPARYDWMRKVGRPATSLEAWPALLKRWFPGLYDTHAEDRFGAANSVDPRTYWTQAVNDLELASRDDYLPELRVEPLFLMPSLWAFAGFMAMVGLISAWMFFLNRRLFLFDLSKALSLSHSTPIPSVIDSNLFVLVSPCDDQAMTWNQRPDLWEVDLTSHNGAEAMEKASIAGIGTGIVLNHFEDRIEDPDVLEDRIRLIEQLVSKPGRRVIVISSVDPFYHLSALTDPVAQKRVARLHGVLSGFTYRTVFQGVLGSSSRTVAAHAA